MSWFFKEKEHAKIYKKFRPIYPSKLYETIFKTLEIVTKKSNWDKCCDIGCGTGLSTLPLISKFIEVIGIDSSQNQLNEAAESCSQYPNVFFKQADAEDLTFIQDNSVDLIAIGQALHWFNIPTISKEFSRILKDKGLFIGYGYSIISLDNLDANNIVINEYYKGILKGYFEDGIQHIEDGYAAIQLQLKNFFPAVKRDDSLEMTFSYNCEDFVGLLSTWSAYQKYRKFNPDKIDPLEDIYKRLKLIYGNNLIKCKAPIFILIISKTKNLLNELTNFGYMDKEFYLRANGTFVNHGSYGTAPKQVLDYRINLIKEMEEQPDIWFRENLEAKLSENIIAISSFVGAKPENLVFVANATTGLNCVLRSLKFTKGDAILITTWTYNAIKNLAFFVAEQQDLKIIFVKMPFPIKSIDEIISAYETALSTNPEIRLVLLDHISSIPPVKMPLEELICLCRKYDKMVAVDGAHAPGQITLNLEKLAPDFYTGNLHKWLFAPRGCAILYVSPKYNSKIFPSTISTYKDGNSLHENFVYQGTMDVTNFISTKMAIQFYEDAGGYDKINNYCEALVSKAEQLLRERWNIGIEQIFPTKMLVPNMRWLPLPNIKHYTLPSTDGHRISSKDLKELMSDIWHKYNVQSIFLSFEGKAWVRICANIYNKIEDYEKLANAILHLNN